MRYFLAVSFVCALCLQCKKPQEPVKVFEPLPPEIVLEENEEIADAISISGDCLLEGSGGVLNLEPVFFDFDSATLTAYAREVLKKNIYCVGQLEDARITVEGHCDERGPAQYNMKLGERRAHAVWQYMTMTGTSPSMLDMDSKGESKPVCTDKSEDCYGMNRRVEFVQH